MEYGEKKECILISKEATNENINTVGKAEQLSYLVDSEFLVRPEMTSISINGKEIVVANIFDCSFGNYKKENDLKFLDRPQGILRVWWRNQITNILKTVEDMHKQNVFHGDLSKDENYVIVDNMMHIIMSGIDGRDMDDSQIKSNVKKDLRDFASFLSKHINTGVHSSDWVLFHSLCLNAHPNVAQVRNHPFLKDEPTRLNRLEALLDCCRDRWELDDAQWDNKVPGIRGYLDFELDSMYNPLVGSQGGWNSLIPAHTCYATMFVNPPWYVKPYNPTSYLDLIRYVRNVLNHVHQKAHKTDGEIERDIQAMFPGFVSKIHNICVEFGPANSSVFKATAE